MGAEQIIHNMPFDEYLNLPHWSQSSLKEMRESPAHAKVALGQSKPQTDAMLLGSALHVAFLEPELMPSRVVLWDGARRAGAAWEEFKVEHAGRIILTQGLHAKLTGMVRSMRDHPFVRQWAGEIKDVEVSAIGDVNGLTMKGRCDALTSDPLIDIKKVASANPHAVAKSAIQYGYHIQACVYRTLFDRDRFILLCVEDSEPYDVVPYELTAAFLGLGASETARLVERVLECEASGVWTGRSAVEVELDPPSWAAEPAKPITMGGKPLYGLPVESDPMGLEI